MNSVFLFVLLLFLPLFTLEAQLLCHADEAALNAVESMHQSVQSQMVHQEAILLPKIEILWRAMVMRNTTLQLALAKMAEKTDPKHAHASRQKTQWTQSMLRGMVQIGGMGASVVAGNPAPLIGSAMITRAALPNTADPRLTTITSADLVILAREIEAAQTRILAEYLAYQNAQIHQSQLQSELTQLEAQRLAVAGHGDLADTLNTMIEDAYTQLQRARETTETTRHILIISAGEPAVHQVDQLPSAVPTALEYQPTVMHGS